MEKVIVRINELRPGSVEMDISVAVQTKEPDRAMEKLLEILRSSMHPKYNIQELKPIRGK